MHASGKVPPGTDTGRSEYCHPDLITSVMPDILKYDSKPEEIRQSSESFVEQMKDVGSWLSCQWFSKDSDGFYSLPPILIDFPLGNTLDSREILRRVKQFARHRTISPNASNVQFWHMVTHACHVLLVLEQFSTDAWTHVVPHNAAWPLLGTELMTLNFTSTITEITKSERSTLCAGKPDKPKVADRNTTAVYMRTRT
eukprot:2034433-Prymnesium_polylepis.1